MKYSERFNPKVARDAGKEWLKKPANKKKAAKYSIIVVVALVLVSWLFTREG